MARDLAEMNEDFQRQLRVRLGDLRSADSKEQPELTDHYGTTDIAEAFLNDPYDWAGPKDLIAYATGADSDGALTMQIQRCVRTPGMSTHLSVARLDPARTNPV